MEPPRSYVDESGTLHMSKKVLTTAKVSLQSIVPCCLLSPFHGGVSVIQFPSELSLSNEAGCHGHAVFGSAGSTALFSVKTLIK